MAVEDGFAVFRVTGRIPAHVLPFFKLSESRGQLRLLGADVTRDGKLLVYLGVGPSEVQTVIRDLQTGRETTMTQVKEAYRMALSPDGRFLALVASQGSARSASVVVVPLA